MDFNNADVDGLFVNKTAIGSVTSPPKAARIDAALAKRSASSVALARFTKCVGNAFSANAANAFARTSPT